MSIFGGFSMFLIKFAAKAVIVNVFPVPGGPMMRVNLSFIPMMTALVYESEKRLGSPST